MGRKPQATEERSDDTSTSETRKTIHEAMYKNAIQGPVSGASEPSVAKPSGLRHRVNGALAWRKWMLLSGETSLNGSGGFQSIRKTGTALPAMRVLSSKEESAEGIVVV